MSCLAAGEAAIAVVGFYQLPALAADEGLAGFALTWSELKSCSSPSSDDLRV
jgi:hypothetical protein